MATTTASEVPDRELPEIRAGLLQLAAQLDRLDRAQGSALDDARLQVQLIFSRPYEDDWKAKMEVGIRR